MGTYDGQMSAVIRKIRAVGRDLAMPRDLKIAELERLSKEYGDLDYLDDAEDEYMAGGPAHGSPYFPNRDEIEAFIDRMEAPEQD